MVFGFLELLEIQGIYTGMSNVKHSIMSNSSAAGFERAIHTLNEPELSELASSAALRSPADRWANVGALVFWALVVCLLTARVMLFDAANYQPVKFVESGQSQGVDTIAR
jgi:hypothetical protein